MDEILALITVVGATIAAVLVIVGSILSLVAKKRVRDQVQRIEIQVKQVHELVNSRMSDMENRVKQLIATLDSSGVPVPPSPEREGKKDAGS